MKLTFFQTPDALAQTFPLLRPLFQRVVDEAAHGEFTVDDLEQLARAKKVILGMVRQDGAIRLAFAFEFIAYPQLLTLNLMAIAGSQLNEALPQFLPLFQEFAREAGAQAIEASCSPAMARLLAHHGFETTYQRVRCPILEKIHHE